MSIKDDLEKAENAVKDIVTLDAAIKLICTEHQLSESEVARWLILNEVHRNINLYFLIPSIPKVEKCTAEQVVVFLQRIISPSWIDALALFQRVGQQMDKFEAIDINELNAFLESKAIGAITLKGATLEQGINLQHERNETMPQKRLRMIVESLTSNEGYSDIQALPTTAKNELRKELIDTQKTIFTKSTFNKAWSDASAQGIIGLADKKKFTPRP